MVATDFKLRYQASVLGYLWTLLRPLALFTILYMVFVRLLGVMKTIPHSAIYLLLGIVLWGFFAEATGQALTSLVARADLLRKIAFPRYVVVISTTVSALISFGLSMIVIVLFMVITRVSVHSDIVWLPLLFVELAAFSLSLAFFVSALFVRFRDMSYIWEVLLQAAFYATPIIYPLSLISTSHVRAARLLLLNPMAQIIQDARYVLVTNQTQTITQLYGNPWVRVIPVGITVVLVIASALFFRWLSPSFAEEV